jgi:hypothetical protein
MMLSIKLKYSLVTNLTQKIMLCYFPITYSRKIISCLQVNFVGSKLVEHPQTQAYKFIVQDCIIIHNITKTMQDGNTSSIPEEAKVKVCSAYVQALLP